MFFASFFWCIISLNIMANAPVTAPLANFPPPISETVPLTTALTATEPARFKELS